MVAQKFGAERRSTISLHCKLTSHVSVVDRKASAYLWVTTHLCDITRS
jgi:hypothetical protein